MLGSPQPRSAWGVVLLVAVPRGLGSGLLGPIWRQTYPLVVPMTLCVMGQAVGTGAGTGLHALGAAKRSLRYDAYSRWPLAVCSLWPER